MFTIVNFINCITCNKQVQQGIYNSRFLPNLLTLLSAFVVLAILVLVLSAITAKQLKRSFATNPGSLSAVPLTTASMVLGIGLGGFADGIILHQVLQWHEMLSNKIPATDYVGKSVNMFWDGVFHFFCLLVVFVGVVLFWKLLKRNDINRSGWLLSGGLLAGWGLFNIVEGVIDHHLLKLHNVFEYAEQPGIYNYFFLGASVLMLIVAYAMVQKAKRQAVSTR